MAFIRITHNDFEERHNAFDGDTFHDHEWKDDSRIEEEAWKVRYK